MSNPIIEYMRLLRLWNGAIAALGFLLGAAVALGLGEVATWGEEIVLGVVVVVLFVGAGNSLNDYFDTETDRVAHPVRPLVKGTITRRSALATAALLFSASIITSVFLNMISLAIVVLAVIAMVTYEFRLKRIGLAGNATIAALVFALFEFAGSAVDRIESTIILASLAGLATLGREIVKDIEDFQGDIARRTLPRVIGVRKAGLVALVPTFAAVALSPIPYLLDQLTYLYLIVVIIADLLFVYGGIMQLRNPTKGQKIYKIGMIVALIAFAVGVNT